MYILSMIGFSRFEAVWITKTPPMNIEITPTRRIDESMSLSDSFISCLQKILAFSGVNDESDDPDHNEFVVKRPILVVGPIPDGETMPQIDYSVQDAAYTDEGWFDANMFNFFTVDGDYYAAHPGINTSGCFELFGDDSSQLYDQDELRTARAYRAARCARFEHGERRPGS